MDLTLKQIDVKNLVLQFQQYHYAIIDTLINCDMDHRQKQINQNLPEEWESLVTFILNISYKYSMQDKTRELSIIMLKSYILKSNQSVQDLQLYYQLALICLSLSTKLEEERIFCTKNILIELNYQIDIVQLEILEQQVLQTLEWKLNLVTPIDFSKMLLHYLNNDFDFTEICGQINNFVYLCLLDQELAIYDSCVISLTCIFSALEHLSMINFRNQIATFTHEYFPQIDLLKVLECKKILDSRLNPEQVHSLNINQQSIDNMIQQATSTCGNTNNNFSPQQKSNQMRYNSDFKTQSDPSSLEFLFSSLCQLKRQSNIQELHQIAQNSNFNEYALENNGIQNNHIQQLDVSKSDSQRTRFSTISDSERQEIIVNSFKTFNKSKFNNHNQLCPLNGDRFGISEKEIDSCHSFISGSSEGQNIQKVQTESIHSENIFSSTHTFQDCQQDNKMIIRNITNSLIPKQLKVNKTILNPSQLKNNTKHRYTSSLSSVPHIFVSHVELYFKQQQLIGTQNNLNDRLINPNQPHLPQETNISENIEQISPSDQYYPIELLEGDGPLDQNNLFDNDKKTLKYSIVSDEEHFNKENQVYRQLRYLKSNSSLKDSLISMFIHSSILVPAEEKTHSGCIVKDLKTQRSNQDEPEIKPFSLKFANSNIGNQNQNNILGFLQNMPNLESNKPTKNKIKIPQQSIYSANWNPFQSYQSNFKSPGSLIAHNK